MTGAFPLRVTDYLSNQIDTFLRPSVEDTLYTNIHGPGNALRRQRLAGPSADAHALLQPVPIVARPPVDPTALPGPGHSSTRGYMPSAVGLQSTAYLPPAASTAAGAASVLVTSTPSHSVSVNTGPPRTFTPNELAARTPRIFQALSGPDSNFWVPGIVKDFDVLRAQ